MSRTTDKRYVATEDARVTDLETGVRDQRSIGAGGNLASRDAMRRRVGDRARADRCVKISII
jgi:hypothetical protein